jgi:hypothetical protein
MPWWYQELFKQDLAGMNVGQFRHFGSSVIIHDLDIHRALRSPDKTDPPLVIDADAVLSRPAPSHHAATLNSWSRRVP